MYAVRLKITTVPPSGPEREKRKSEAEAEELAQSLTPATIMALSLDPVRAQRTLMEIDRLRGIANLEQPTKATLERSYLSLQQGIEYRYWEYYFAMRNVVGKEKKAPDYLSRFY